MSSDFARVGGLSEGCYSWLRLKVKNSVSLIYFEKKKFSNRLSQEKFFHLSG